MNFLQRAIWPPRKKSYNGTGPGVRIRADKIPLDFMSKGKSYVYLSKLVDQYAPEHEHAMALVVAFESSPSLDLYIKFLSVYICMNILLHYQLPINYQYQ